MVTVLPAWKPSASGTSAGRVPPLENGAYLSAREFLRRYDAMPELKKAELVNGIVYMASLVRLDQHGEPDNLIQGEYVVWRTEDGAVDWWVLEEDEYRPLPAGTDGVLRSRAFPGLWLDVAGQRPLQPGAGSGDPAYNGAWQAALRGVGACSSHRQLGEALGHPSRPAFPLNRRGQTGILPAR